MSIFQKIMRFVPENIRLHDAHTRVYFIMYIVIVKHTHTHHEKH